MLARAALLGYSGPNPTARSLRRGRSGVIAARHRGLRVPEDVSVAGFDGLWLPWLAPVEPTSVEQPLTEKGRLTALVAAELADGGHPPFRRLPVTLRVGTTTGPGPA